MKRAGTLLVVFMVMVVSACVGGGGVVEDADDETIEVFGPWRGVDADRFAAVLRVFEDASGIDVRYVGSANFVVDLENRIGEGNDPADIAVVPQLGLIEQLAANGDIVPVSQATEEAVVESFGADRAQLGTVDGALYTVPYRITVKSLVWYRPAVFEANEWSVPTSLDELLALVARIDGTGDVAPWCLGIESGTATGWVATDWIEDLVVRSLGPGRYQQWVDGNVAFADPDIIEVFRQFRSLALTGDRSFGGIRSVIETPVSEATAPLFSDPAGCALHRQADFAVNWFPSGTSIGPDDDVDFFVLPGEVAGSAPPLVIGGDQIVQFRNSSDVDALMTFLASSEAAEVWARRGGFLSGNRALTDDVYPANYLRELTDAFDTAPAVVLDASDQMPPAIGSGLLWETITDWVAGKVDDATLAMIIDDAVVAEREAGAV